MRACDHRFHTGNIEEKFTFIARSRIGGDLFRAGAFVCGTVGHGLVVGGEESCLAARFNGHVGDGQAAFHIQSFNGRPVEFNGLVQRAVHTDFSDEAEHKVFASYPAGQSACIGGPYG